MNQGLVQKLANVVSHQLINVRITPHDPFRTNVVKYIEYPDAYRIVETLVHELDRLGYTVEKKP
jgi:hypothetical protein